MTQYNLSLGPVPTSRCAQEAHKMLPAGRLLSTSLHIEELQLRINKDTQVSHPKNLEQRTLKMCSLTVRTKTRRFRATIDHDRHSIPQCARTNLAKFTVRYSLNTARAPEAEGPTQLTAHPAISHNNRQNLPRSIHHNFFLQMCSLCSPQ
jgi:hypothetical protein